MQEWNSEQVLVLLHNMVYFSSDTDMAVRDLSTYALTLVARRVAACTDGGNIIAGKVNC